MKHIGNEIDRIIREKDLKTKDVADKIGITSVYLSQIKKKSSIDSDLLEKVANALEVPVYLFFGELPASIDTINASSSIVNKNVVAHSINKDNRHYYSDSPDVLRAQIDLLDERIKEKDSQIKEKDSQIKELLNILKNNK